MLSININKDVEQYQEAVLAGFNASQFIALLMGGGAFAGSFALLHYKAHIPMMVCVYIALIPAIPLVLTGFGAKNGMTFYERLKRIVKRRKAPLFYEATESAENFQKHIPKNGDEKIKKLEFENQKKRMKTAVCIMAGIFLLLAAAVFILKKAI